MIFLYLGRDLLFEESMHVKIQDISRQLSFTEDYIHIGWLSISNSSLKLFVPLFLLLEQNGSVI